MARPHPTQNVSFQEVVPPSRRAGREGTPPPLPNKVPSYAKSTLSSNSVPQAGALDYDNGYIDAQGSNPQGFSASNGADVRRKKSMVKPERERIDPGHRLWHYREHAAEDQMNVMPSCEYSPVPWDFDSPQQPAISHTPEVGVEPIFAEANPFSLASPTKWMKGPV